MSEIPPQSAADRVNQLQELAEQVRRCTKCPLHRTRTNAVPGEGPPEPAVLFIGEAPGQREDEQGRPFVGPSGRLLEELLAEAGMTREQVFITNIVKCRPPGNRDPLPEEISACAPYLERQMELLNPELIATLGRYSMERFFPGARITRIHGKAERRGARVFIPLYHPAYVLRNERAMPEAIRDMRLIPRLLARLRQVLAEEAQSGVTPPAPAPEPELPAPAQQLGLFDQ